MPFANVLPHKRSFLPHFNHRTTSAKLPTPPRQYGDFLLTLLNQTGLVGAVIQNPYDYLASQMLLSATQRVAGPSLLLFRPCTPNRVSLPCCPFAPPVRSLPRVV